MIRAVAPLLIVAAMTACTDTERAAIPLQLGDPVVYAAEVQPYVGLRCGSLDCHGDVQHALRIEAEFGLRRSAALRDTPVSADELAANVGSFAALAGDDDASHLALLKGLAPAAGGMAHIGGDVWLDTGAAGYRCLAAWLGGRSDATACGEAAAEVAPLPATP